MKKTLTIISLLGIVALLAGCEKEKETKNQKYRPAGSEISFSAATGYENVTTRTRTVYSGELTGTTSKFERIDWEQNDPMTIMYVNGGTPTTAVYKVTDVQSSTDQTSKASIEAVNGKLSWGSEDGHLFYALYPAASRNSAATLVKDGTNIKVSGVIPAAQTVKKTATQGGQEKLLPNMDYAYMVAYTAVDDESSTSSVHLPFKPAFTAFEFKLCRQDDAPANPLTSFTMKSTAGDEGSDLTGNFSFNITGGDTSGATWGDVTVTNAGREITYTFPEGFTLPEKSTGYADFCLLALPVDQKQINITLNYANGSHRSLDLKHQGTWETFTGAKKYIITNTVTPSSWVYTLEEVDTEGTVITVTDMVVNTPATGHGGHIGHYPAQSLTKPFISYKENPQTGEQALVNVKIEYAPAGEDGSIAGDWGDTYPDWLGYAVSTQPAADAPTASWISQADFTQVTCDMSVTFNEIETSKQRIQAIAARDQFTFDAPQDLSLYDINSLNGNARSSGKPKTANCYVVDRKGWFMFPLVYGNAIDWDWAPENGWNSSSWRDNDTGDHTFDNYHLAHFQNYIAGWISSPYILDDVNLTVDDVEAVIVWEDASTPFITETETSVKVFNPYTESTTKFVEEDGTTKKVVPFIRFEVNDDIMQGNAMIALREKTGDKRIIWSWHIWVTDLDMGTLNVPQRGGVVTNNDMMKYNLGWCDMRIGRKYSYVPRIYYVRISHDEDASDAEPLVFKVVESLDPYYTITQSSGTYYQLMRKDPFLPGTSNEGLTWGDNVTTPPSYSNAELQVAPHTPGLSRYINKPVYAPHTEYPITTTTDGEVTTSSVSSSQDDMKHVIQHPYIYYDRNDATTMTWLYNKRPWNFWNMYTYRLAYNDGNLQWHANGTEADYSPDYRYDLIVVKTIYDPCPPGFSVPNYAAFTGFTTSGTDLVWRDTGGVEHDFNPPVTWVPADAEHFFDIELYGDFRWYFGTTEGTPIVFPGHGYRSAGQVNGLFGGLYMPTVQKKGDRYVVCLSGWGPVGAGNSRATAYGVRAIKEQPRTGMGL